MKADNEQDTVDPACPIGRPNMQISNANTGERLVFYEYCISLIFISLRRPSAVVRLRPGQRGWIVGLPYTILTLILGWWCIPWGLLYTPLCLWTNLSGGRLLTADELHQWGQAATSAG
jgi:hypothetical protein